MSNKKVVASVAASLSLLAAPSARGMGLLKASVIIGTGSALVYGGYKFLTASDIIDLLKKIDWKSTESISSTFGEIVGKVFEECGNGIYKVTSGAKKGCYFAIAEIKDTCGKVKSVVVSSTSKKNISDQLLRLQDSGAVIDGECIDEVSDFFGKTLLGKGSFGDKVGKATEIIINLFIRSFANKFFGYSSFNVGTGVRIIQVAGFSNEAGNCDNMPIDGTMLKDIPNGADNYGNVPNGGTMLEGTPDEKKALEDAQNFFLRNQKIVKNLIMTM